MYSEDRVADQDQDQEKGPRPRKGLGNFFALCFQTGKKILSSVNRIETNAIC